MSEYIELNPVVIVDGKVKDEKEWTLVKDRDTSFEIRFREDGSTLKCTPPLIYGGLPKVYVNGRMLSNDEYHQKTQSKAGITLTFKGQKFKRIDLIPRVMDKVDFKNKEVKEARERYAQEHSEVVKYWK